MNNFEKIKNMNIDEMAEMFFYTKPKGCGFCEGAYMGCLRQADCIQAIKSWLKSTKAPAGYNNNRNFWGENNGL